MRGTVELTVYWRPLMNLLRALTDVRPQDIVDIVVVALVMYGLLIGLRQIRIRAIARLVVVLAALYAFAQVFGLRLTTHLFHVSLTVAGIVVVILYRDELRSALDRLIARMTYAYRKPGSGRDAASAFPWITTLAKTLFDLANRKVGALVVINGRDDLTRHLTGGTPLDGEISEALLWSVFDPNSMGHDGAMVIEKERASRFQAHLPLSTNFEQLKQRGTRHAAALGLAERTDALCLVVSEERGIVSIAHENVLQPVADAAALAELTEQHVRSSAGERTERGPVWSWKHAGPVVTAVVLAYLLWFLFVHEAATEYRSFEVPVEFTGLDSSLSITSTEPSTVKVILSGPRRAFYFVGPSHIAVQVPLLEFEPGDHQLTLTASEVSRPNNLAFANLFPREVSVHIQRPAATSGAGRGSPEPSDR